MGRLIRRLTCLFRGHVNAMTVLPEDGWGLYAFSRRYCSRCNQTFSEPYPFAQLAQYNSEVGRGVVHEPWMVERMAIQQAYFDQQLLDEARAAGGLVIR